MTLILAKRALLMKLTCYLPLIVLMCAKNRPAYDTHDNSNNNDKVNKAYHGILGLYNYKCSRSRSMVVR